MEPTQPPEPNLDAVPTGEPPAPAPAVAPALAPPPAWWLLLLFIAVVVPVILGAMVLQAASGLRSPMGAGILATQLCFLLPALLWARLSGLRPGRLLRLTAPSGAALLIGAGTGLAGLPAGAGLMSAWKAVLPEWLLARFDAGAELAALGWGPWQLVPLVVLLPALVEELTFRGALQGALLRRRSVAGAILGSAVVFAAVHFDPVRLPGVLLLGLAYGWLTWRTGSLWPSMLAHAVNNGAAVLLLLAGDQNAPDPTERLSMGDAVVVLAVGLAMLALVVVAARRWLPPAPHPASFLVPRRPAPATTAAAAPSPSGSDLP